MLPAAASVVSWCTLASGPRSFGPSVEFEIRLRTQNAEASTRCLVRPATSWFGRTLVPVAYPRPGPGPARIVFATRRAGSSAPDDDTCALWGDPRIEVPRSLADLAIVLRSAMSDHEPSCLWHQVLPANGERLYRLWVRENEPSARALRAQHESSRAWTRSFTLITYLAEPASWSPQLTAASVLSQSYPRWEWILVAPEDSIDEIQDS